MERKGRKCESRRTCTRAKSSFRSTRLHFTVSHEMILHSFKHHIAYNSTVSHCMNFNMRRSDVIPFTGFAVRETHATWLCDHLCLRCAVYVESIILDDLCVTDSASQGQWHYHNSWTLQEHDWRCGCRCVGRRAQGDFCRIFPCSHGMFFWPSKAQCPDYTHLSTLEQTRSTLIWTEKWTSCCVRIAFGAV